MTFGILTLSEMLSGAGQVPAPPFTPKVSPPDSLWSLPLGTSVPTLKLLAATFIKDSSGKLGVDFVDLPAAFSEEASYGPVYAVAEPEVNFIAKSLSLNRDLIPTAPDSGHERSRLGAQMLLALSNADMVLSLPGKAGETAWTLWCRNKPSGNQEIYSETSKGVTLGAQGDRLDAKTYAQFMQNAFGFDAYIVAVDGANYLVRINNNATPAVGSLAYGLDASAKFLRVTPQEKQRGLGLLKVRKAVPGWAVYQVLSSKINESWPVGTKLILEQSRP